MNSSKKESKKNSQKIDEKSPHKNQNEHKEIPKPQRSSITEKQINAINEINSQIKPGKKESHKILHNKPSNRHSSFVDKSNNHLNIYETIKEEDKAKEENLHHEKKEEKILDHSSNKISQSTNNSKNSISTQPNKHSSFSNTPYNFSDNHLNKPLKMENDKDSGKSFFEKNNNTKNIIDKNTRKNSFIDQEKEKSMPEKQSHSIIHESNSTEKNHNAQNEEKIIRPKQEKSNKNPIESAKKKIFDENTSNKNFNTSKKDQNLDHLSNNSLDEMNLIKKEIIPKEKHVPIGEHLKKQSEKSLLTHNTENDSKNKYLKPKDRKSEILTDKNYFKDEILKEKERDHRNSVIESKLNKEMGRRGLYTQHHGSASTTEVLLLKETQEPPILKGGLYKTANKFGDLLKDLSIKNEFHLEETTTFEKKPTVVIDDNQLTDLPDIEKAYKLDDYVLKKKMHEKEREIVSLRKKEYAMGKKKKIKEIEVKKQNILRTIKIVRIQRWWREMKNKKKSQEELVFCENTILDENLETKKNNSYKFYDYFAVFKNLLRTEKFLNNDKEKIDFNIDITIMENKNHLKKFCLIKLTKIIKDFEKDFVEIGCKENTQIKNYIDKDNFVSLLNENLLKIIKNDVFNNIIKVDDPIIGKNFRNINKFFCIKKSDKIKIDNYETLEEYYHHNLMDFKYLYDEMTNENLIYIQLDNVFQNLNFNFLKINNIKDKIYNLNKMYDKSEASSIKIVDDNYEIFNIDGNSYLDFKDNISLINKHEWKIDEKILLNIKDLINNHKYYSCEITNYLKSFIKLEKSSKIDVEFEEKVLENKILIGYKDYFSNFTKIQNHLLIFGNLKNSSNLNLKFTEKILNMKNFHQIKKSHLIKMDKEIIYSINKILFHDFKCIFEKISVEKLSNKKDEIEKKCHLKETIIGVKNFQNINFNNLEKLTKVKSSVQIRIHESEIKELENKKYALNNYLSNYNKLDKINFKVYFENEKFNFDKFENFLIEKSVNLKKFFEQKQSNKPEKFEEIKSLANPNPNSIQNLKDLIGKLSNKEFIETKIIEDFLSNKHPTIIINFDEIKKKYLNDFNKLNQFGKSGHIPTIDQILTLKNIKDNIIYFSSFDSLSEKDMFFFLNQLLKKINEKSLDKNLKDEISIKVNLENPMIKLEENYIKNLKNLIKIVKIPQTNILCDFSEIKTLSNESFSLTNFNEKYSKILIAIDFNDKYDLKINNSNLEFIDSKNILKNLTKIYNLSKSKSIEIIIETKVYQSLINKIVDFNSLYSILLKNSLIEIKCDVLKRFEQTEEISNEKIKNLKNFNLLKKQEKVIYDFLHKPEKSGGKKDEKSGEEKFNNYEEIKKAPKIKPNFNNNNNKENPESSNILNVEKAVEILGMNEYEFIMKFISYIDFNLENLSIKNHLFLEKLNSKELFNLNIHNIKKTNTLESNVLDHVIKINNKIKLFEKNKEISKKLSEFNFHEIKFMNLIKLPNEYLKLKDQIDAINDNLKILEENKNPLDLKEINEFFYKRENSSNKKQKIDEKIIQKTKMSILSKEIFLNDLNVFHDSKNSIKKSHLKLPSLENKSKISYIVNKKSDLDMDDLDLSKIKRKKNHVFYKNRNEEKYDDKDQNDDKDRNYHNYDDEYEKLSNHFKKIFENLKKNIPNFSYRKNFISNNLSKTSFDSHHLLKNYFTLNEKEYFIDKLQENKTLVKSIDLNKNNENMMKIVKISFKSHENKINIENNIQKSIIKMKPKLNQLNLKFPNISYLKDEDLNLLYHKKQQKENLIINREYDKENIRKENNINETLDSFKNFSRNEIDNSKFKINQSILKNEFKWFSNLNNKSIMLSEQDLFKKPKKFVDSSTIEKNLRLSNFNKDENFFDSITHLKFKDDLSNFNNSKKIFLRNINKINMKLENFINNKSYLGDDLEKARDYLENKNNINYKVIKKKYPEDYLDQNKLFSMKNLNTNIHLDDKLLKLNKTFKFSPVLDKKKVDNLDNMGKKADLDIKNTNFKILEYKKLEQRRELLIKNKSHLGDITKKLFNELKMKTESQNIFNRKNTKLNLSFKKEEVKILTHFKSDKLDINQILIKDMQNNKIILDKKVNNELSEFSNSIENIHKWSSDSLKINKQKLKIKKLKLPNKPILSESNKVSILNENETFINLKTILKKFSFINKEIRDIYKPLNDNFNSQENKRKKLKLESFKSCIFVNKNFKDFDNIFKIYSTLYNEDFRLHSIKDPKFNRKDFENLILKVENIENFEKIFKHDFIYKDLNFLRLFFNFYKMFQDFSKNNYEIISNFNKKLILEFNFELIDKILDEQFNKKQVMLILYTIKNILKNLGANDIGSQDNIRNYAKLIREILSEKYKFLTDIFNKLDNGLKCSKLINEIGLLKKNRNKEIILRKEMEKFFDESKDKIEIFNNKSSNYYLEIIDDYHKNYDDKFKNFKLYNNIISIEKSIGYIMEVRLYLEKTSTKNDEEKLNTIEKIYEIYKRSFEGDDFILKTHEEVISTLFPETPKKKEIKDKKIQEDKSKDEEKQKKLQVRDSPDEILKKSIEGNIVRKVKEKHEFASKPLDKSILLKIDRDLDEKIIKFEKFKNMLNKKKSNIESERNDLNKRFQESQNLNVLSFSKINYGYCLFLILIFLMILFGLKVHEKYIEIDNEILD